MWTRDEVRGKVDRVKGRLKEEFGDMIDDELLEEQGRAERAKGEMEEGIGRARRKIGKSVKDLGNKISR